MANTIEEDTGPPNQVDPVKLAEYQDMVENGVSDEARQEFLTDLGYDEASAIIATSISETDGTEPTDQS